MKEEEKVKQPEENIEVITKIPTVPDIDTISVNSVVDTLKALEYGYSGYGIKDDQLKGAYIFASELTGLSVADLSSYVNSGAAIDAAIEHIKEKDDKDLTEPEEDVDR